MFVRMLAASAVMVSASVASAGTSFFSLSDHPDGNANPPGYGLRFDGLFAGEAGANGGVTTFSMNTFGNTILSVATAGMSTTISITGTLYGGEDTGASYGFGEGSYELSMTYTVNVNAQGTGWVVSGPNAGNAGTLTALSGDVAGNVYDLRDFGTPSFLFLQDEHRLGGHDEAGDGFWVGRGWLADASGDRGLTRDFLFLGEAINRPPLVPLPAPVALGLAGLGMISMPRRR